MIEGKSDFTVRSGDANVSNKLKHRVKGNNVTTLGKHQDFFRNITLFQHTKHNNDNNKTSSCVV